MGSVGFLLVLGDLTWFSVELLSFKSARVSCLVSAVAVAFAETLRSTSRDGKPRKNNTEHSCAVSNTTTEMVLALALNSSAVYLSRFIAFIVVLPNSASQPFPCTRTTGATPFGRGRFESCNAPDSLSGRLCQLLDLRVLPTQRLTYLAGRAYEGRH